jgi:uncharacterized protein
MPHPAASSVLSHPEGRAALAAARHDRSLTQAAHRRARGAYDALQRELVLVGVDEQLARHAGDLAELHALRGYDAVHLATALALSPKTTVVTWDRDLGRAAAASGCGVAPAVAGR